MNTTEEKDELNLITLAQQYSDDDKARELLESLLWPHGAYCPHCKADMPYKLTPKATSKRPARKGLLQVPDVPQTIHRDRGHHFRGFPHSDWKMAHGNLSSLPQQKGNERTSDSPDAQNHLQERMVYDAPAPLCGGSKSPAW